MSKAIRNHLRHNVYGMVAIFIALSGTAYAVDGTNPGVNTIGSEDIIGGEVKSSDIGNGLVSSVDLKNETLTDADLGTDSVQADEIRYWSIGSDELALSAVGDAHIRDNAVRPDEIQEDAVGQSEIAPDAVGGLELAPNAAGSAEILDNSVGSNELKGPLIVESAPKTIDNTGNPQLDVAYATCPANYQLLGGGGERQEIYLYPTAVFKDRPVGDSWAWGLIIPGDDNNSYTIRAYAICMAP